MILNDLSGEEEEELSLLKMRSWKALFLLRTCLLNLIVLMTSSLMMMMILPTTE
jgi:hypothetical protein